MGVLIMKYLLVGDEDKILFIEDDEQRHSVFYSKYKKKWLPGGDRLWRYRVGFDESEPEDSIYRYGNSSCMPDIVEITKEEAEAFISKEINEDELRMMLNCTTI